MKNSRAQIQFPSHILSLTNERRSPQQADSPLPPAAFDSDFGNEGILYLKINGISDAWASQPVKSRVKTDHYIVGFFGSYTSQPNTCGVFRFDSRGALDTSFGMNNQGYVEFRFGQSDGYCDFLGIQENVDGSIFIWGRYEPEVLGNDSHFISKLTPWGDPDVSFGNRGHVNLSTLPANGQLRVPFLTAVKINNDGSVYFLGEIINSSIKPYLGKLDPAGNLDKTFQDGGLREIYVGAAATANGLFTDGENVVVYGYRLVGNGGYLIRYTHDGEIDRAFGEEGIVELPSNRRNWIYNVAISHDNTAIVAGEDRTTLDSDSMLWECTLQGEGTLRFNEGAPLYTQFGSSNDYWICAQKKLSPDGKLIAIGQALNTYPVVIGRFTEDAKVDETFAPGDNQFCGLANASIDLLSPSCFVISTPQQILCAGRHMGQAAVFALKV